MASRSNKKPRSTQQKLIPGNPGAKTPSISNGATAKSISSASVKPEQSGQIDAAYTKALEKLTVEDLESLTSSPPSSFNPDDLWEKAQSFNLANTRLENEHKEIEQQKQKLEILQDELKSQQQKLNDESNLLQDEREQQKNELKSQQQKLNDESNLLQSDREQQAQKDKKIIQRERKLREDEANATAGYLAQNQLAISQLEQQIGDLSQEIAQTLSQKVEIQKQAKLDISRHYSEFERESSIVKEELEQERKKFISERNQLRQVQSRLEADRELLAEDLQSFDEKVTQRAGQRLQGLENQVEIQGQCYLALEVREKQLAAKCAKLIDANRRFQNRSPDEILAEIEGLRRQNEELEQKLAERPTEAAVKRLEELETQKEQWESERFQRVTRGQELERLVANNRIAVLNLETLRDEKEALEASNNRLRSALDELKITINDGITQAQERSPFEKCIQLDRDEKLQLTPISSSEPVDLAQFAQDLRYRIALSPSEKDKRLYYSDRDIRSFLGGIAMSRLHLLQGISGTGKTSLPIAFARALGQRGQNNYKLIEVQAGWRDRQDLIGYYNSFERKFYETEFLTALYEAQCPQFQDRIYIIVLDEMNLSRPEQYFAEFLSKLEQDNPTLILNTDLERPSPQLFPKRDTLVIPPNVWFVGTANQDETTLEFADKTYDRAHIMELARSHESFDIPDQLPSRHPISYELLIKAFKKAQDRHADKAAKAFKFLNERLSEVLERKFKIGWGNRLERQMYDYIPVVIAAGGSLTEATDHLLVTKILRKVRDRHDTRPGDLKELQETIEIYWDELDTDKPVQSLKLLESELQRLDRGAY